ncbi:YdcF family protein [soil metagenome]
MSAVRTALRTVFVLVALLLAAWLGSALAIIGFASRDNARPADAIVVLGAAQYAGRPSPVLKARLDHALQLWERKMATRFIVTGGVGPGDVTSEAAVARAYVEKAGVPADSVLLEPAGRTTSESMEAVAAIMESEGMERAVLVSDPFHMFRLWLLSRRYGITAHTSPVRGRSWQDDRNQRWGYILRESVKAPAALFLDPSR